MNRRVGTPLCPRVVECAVGCAAWAHGATRTAWAHRIVPPRGHKTCRRVGTQNVPTLRLLQKTTRYG